MDFDVYRDKRNHNHFHLHSVGSKCEFCSPPAVETNIEMPDDIYTVVGGKLTERGYILMPHDGANSEPVSTWWQLISLLMQ